MNWTATLKGGKALQQFPPEKGGKETLFSEIDLDKLVSFRVEDFDRSAEVWPKKKEYSINDGKTHAVDIDNDGKPLELIYFRRNRCVIGTGGVTANHTYIQCVGLRNRGKSGEKRHRKVLIELGKDYDKVISE